MPESYSVLMTVEELQAATIALELHRLRRGDRVPGDEILASRWRAAEALELRLAQMAERYAPVPSLRGERDG